MQSFNITCLEVQMNIIIAYLAPVFLIKLDFNAVEFVPQHTEAHVTLNSDKQVAYLTYPQPVLAVW